MISSRVSFSRRCGRFNQGFTLIELLAVMAIMVMLTSLVIGGFLGMTTGAASRSAMTHLMSAMTEARQMAILRASPVYVFFHQEDSPNPEMSMFVLCREEGSVTHGGGVQFGDEFNDLAGIFTTGSGSLIAGGLVYNIDQQLRSADPSLIATSMVTSCTSPDPESGNLPMATTVGNAAWGIGDHYGWVLGHAGYLPKHFFFGGSSGPSCPKPIRFLPDGTTQTYDGGSFKEATRVITFYEKTNPDYIMGVRVDYIGTLQALYDI